MSAKRKNSAGLRAAKRALLQAGAVDIAGDEAVARPANGVENAASCGVENSAANDEVIVSARFLLSAEFAHQAPKINLPCVAMLGRSNVGKSSLINALCNHRGLAKSSSTPGKTRLINFFEARFGSGKRLVIIDLPGFGYARVSRSERDKWNRTLGRFLMDSPHIGAYLHLLDSRHESLAIDEQSEEFLRNISPNTAYVRVFTKIDKLGQSERSRLAAHVKSSQVQAYALSAAKKQGLNKLLSYLHDMAEFSDEDALASTLASEEISKDC